MTDVTKVLKNRKTSIPANVTVRGVTCKGVELAPAVDWKTADGQLVVSKRFEAQIGRREVVLVYAKNEERAGSAWLMTP